MCGEGGAGAGERDVDEVLLVAQAPEGGDHGRVEVVPAQRILLLAARARADRGAACASHVRYNQGIVSHTYNNRYQLGFFRNVYLEICAKFYFPKIIL